MVRIEWEIGTVWPYVETYIVPALEKIGVPFTAIVREDYATVDFWSGADGKSTLLPVYTDQSGTASKLPEFCSGEWKRNVAMRWASEQPGWKERGVDNWIGISWEERRRRRGQRRNWIVPIYPLLDVLPMHVSGCLAAVEAMGWPEPLRSRCFHCPNQSDAEWAELTPEEREAANQLDEHIRTIDPHAFLHKQLIPLREVKLDPASDNGGLFGGCSAGTCY